MAVSVLRAVTGANSIDVGAVYPAEHIDAMVLGAASAEVYTVPADAKFLKSKGTTDFYARRDNAGTIPSTEVTDGSSSALNPDIWVVDGTGTVGFISPAACVITISVYQ